MKSFNFYFCFALIVGIFSSCIREDNTPVKVPPIEGHVVSPEVGGATQPNQVWIDLSENKQTVNKRDIWDLGFYCGEEFRVILNSSIMMAVGKIEGVNNIDAVNSNTVSNLKTLVQVANFEPNEQYVDDPSGNYLTQTTAISKIDADPEKNAVYLLNMGKNLYAGSTVPGTVYTAGEERGWKKIRILQEQNGYKIQFADLDSPTHEEIVIPKNPDYHFKFLSLQNKMTVPVQPEKKKWDLYFSVFTNVIENPAIGSQTSYIFPDMVLTNLFSNVEVYQVKVASGQGESAYNAFKKEDIDYSKFIKNDQRVIGSNWRTTTGPNGAEVFSDRFYVLKDAEGILFKILFTRMKNTEGYRGFPEFEFKPL